MTTPNHPQDPQAPYGQQYGPYGQAPGYPAPPQAPGYPAPPQAPPPPKKSYAPLIIGIVVVLIALCGLGALVSGGGDKADTSGNSGAPAAKQNGAKDTAKDEKSDDTAGMNQPVRDGKFEFAVTNVETGLASVGENQFLTQKAQGEFAVVTLTVKNIGDKAQGFSPSNQKLVDQQGRQHESDATAQIALGGSDIPVWDNINPGNTVTVKLVFDIPKGAVPTTLELHDSMFSGGVKVALTT
ncbi:DUF4352 domain-containing protein [Gordonia crocea]|uniref:DUF4352 domain-containing protein n=1 Tax=Gordonia crocea TaxID=589162 RepID=A0A7I9V280_9ACTN|nr:DUF4352 domain-containing protein [Gordonia crocea]GED99139.1 hypothetical protein nbrc107697_31780 [Gordonia crocea]